MHAKRRPMGGTMAAILLLAALPAAGMAAAHTMPAHDTTPARAAAPTVTSNVSRSALRAPVETGTWSTGMSLSGRLVGYTASNMTVANLMNGRDYGRIPAGFDPDHATGDMGNAYEYSQCTWWAYVRRHQLGLPAGSHMGNGADWADSARRLGYWVDSTPEPGDVAVFPRGVYDSDPMYGHVAIVESVNGDGSFTTSECGSVMHGRTYSRTFTADQAKRLEFIRY